MPRSSINQCISSFVLYLRDDEWSRPGPVATKQGSTETCSLSSLPLCLPALPARGLGIAVRSPRRFIEIADMRMKPSTSSCRLIWTDSHIKAVDLWWAAPLEIECTKEVRWCIGRVRKRLGSRGWRCVRREEQTTHTILYYHFSTDRPPRSIDPFVSITYSVQPRQGLVDRRVRWIESVGGGRWALGVGRRNRRRRKWASGRCVDHHSGGRWAFGGAALGLVERM